MKLFAQSFITTIAIVATLWVMASWVDVCAHNNPFVEDGDPHWWNAFVMLTEIAS